MPAEIELNELRWIVVDEELEDANDEAVFWFDELNRLGRIESKPFCEMEEVVTGDPPLTCTPLRIDDVNPFGRDIGGCFDSPDDERM